jgi:hypothetical protein
MIETKRETVTEAIPDQLDDGKQETIPFIPLSIINDGTEVSITKLLKSWMSDNISTGIRSKLIDGKMVRTETKLLNTYRITNIPKLIALCINRFKHTGRDDTPINISKKISPFPQATDFCTYVFHAAICHKGDSPVNGHYYTILNIQQNNGSNKFYLFDDQNKPSLSQLNMQHSEIQEKLKKECYFLIYRYIG